MYAAVHQVESRPTEVVEPGEAVALLAAEGERVDGRSAGPDPGQPDLAVRGVLAPAERGPRRAGPASTTRPPAGS
jgi:hypothetical protein